MLPCSDLSRGSTSSGALTDVVGEHIKVESGTESSSAANAVVLPDIDIRSGAQRMMAQLQNKLKKTIMSACETSE